MFIHHRFKWKKNKYSPVHRIISMADNIMKRLPYSILLFFLIKFMVKTVKAQKVPKRQWNLQGLFLIGEKRFTFVSKMRTHNNYSDTIIMKNTHQRLSLLYRDRAVTQKGNNFIIHLTIFTIFCLYSNNLQSVIKKKIFLIKRL